mmetsp:Transcript_42760/g.110233  ORF Transcript_42760/g.110233 Transcript_42760/m.110233 type:complete len:721 (-) Transcript_42760:87-2249(-)
MAAAAERATSRQKIKEEEDVALDEVCASLVDALPHFHRRHRVAAFCLIGNDILCLPALRRNTQNAQLGFFLVLYNRVTGARPVWIELEAELRGRVWSVVSSSRDSNVAIISVDEDERMCVTMVEGRTLLYQYKNLSEEENVPNKVRAKQKVFNQTCSDGACAIFHPLNSGVVLVAVDGGVIMHDMYTGKSEEISFLSSRDAEISKAVTISPFNVDAFNAMSYLVQSRSGVCGQVYKVLPQMTAISKNDIDKVYESLERVASDLRLGDAYVAWLNRSSEVRQDDLCITRSSNPPAGIAPVEKQYGIQADADENEGRQVVDAVMFRSAVPISITLFDDATIEFAIVYDNYPGWDADGELSRLYVVKVVDLNVMDELAEAEVDARSFSHLHLLHDKIPAVLVAGGEAVMELNVPFVHDLCKWHKENEENETKAPRDDGEVYCIVRKIPIFDAPVTGHQIGARLISGAVVQNSHTLASRYISPTFFGMWLVKSGGSQDRKIVIHTILLDASEQLMGSGDNPPVVPSSAIVQFQFGRSLREKGEELRQRLQSVRRNPKRGVDDLYSYLMIAEELKAISRMSEDVSQKHREMVEEVKEKTEKLKKKVKACQKEAERSIEKLDRAEAIQDRLEEATKKMREYLRDRPLPMSSGERAWVRGVKESEEKLRVLKNRVDQTISRVSMLEVVQWQQKKREGEGEEGGEEFQAKNLAEKPTWKRRSKLRSWR